MVSGTSLSVMFSLPYQNLTVWVISYSVAIEYDFKGVIRQIYPLYGIEALSEA